VLHNVLFYWTCLKRKYKFIVIPSKDVGVVSGKYGSWVEEGQAKGGNFNTM
jgi:hypothetical protein